MTKFRTPYGQEFAMCEKYSECLSYDRLRTICNEGEGYDILQSGEKKQCDILENFDAYYKRYREWANKRKEIATGLKK